LAKNNPFFLGLALCRKKNQMWYLCAWLFRYV